MCFLLIATLPRLLLLHGCACTLLLLLLRVVVHNYMAGDPALVLHVSCHNGQICIR
eukprot:COSAG06_NODE_15074_length_1099_cov_1.705000_2_plen_56_part_00